MADDRQPTLQSPMPLLELLESASHQVAADPCASSPIGSWVKQMLRAARQTSAASVPAVDSRGERGAEEDIRPSS